MRHYSVRKPKSLQSLRDEKKSAHLVIAVVEPRRDQRSDEVAHHGDHPVGVDGLNVVGHESPASHGVHAQEELNRRRNPLSRHTHPHTESMIRLRDDFRLLDGRKTYKQDLGQIVVVALDQEGQQQNVDRHGGEERTLDCVIQCVRCVMRLRPTWCVSCGRKVGTGAVPFGQDLPRIEEHLHEVHHGEEQEQRSARDAEGGPPALAGTGENGVAHPPGRRRMVSKNANA